MEQGVAAGWPLNLGHDTTGWPLGLRLRLMHEDLQWPRKPELANSTSGISTDSSSLDTVSTRSFFQDNNKSLGTLIGLPMLDPAGNAVGFRHQQQQPQRRLGFGSPSTVQPNNPASSPVLQNASNVLKGRAKARRRHRGRSPANHQQQQHLSTSSPTHAASSIASIAGWSLLSALSCARVPAEIGAGSVKDDYEETSIPRAELVDREIPSSPISVHDCEVHGRADLPSLPHARNASQQRLNSLAKKFYDNITFEDEELELCNKQRRSPSGQLSSDGSSEWNPLFASSPQATRDGQQDEPDDAEYDRSRRKVGPMTNMCDQFLVQRASCTTAVPLMSILGRSNIDPNGVVYCRKGSRLRIGGCPTSLTFCVDVGKWQQKQKQTHLGHGRPQPVNNATDEKFISPQESLRSKIVSAFIYRILCCSSTPTRGSSI